MWPLAIATGIGAGLSYLGSAKANKANRQMSEKQMDFQREMSGTAYQRARADMRAAGLNPILAAKMGGASTPTGASSVSQNEFSGVQQSIASAIELKRMRAEVDNLRAQAEQTRKMTQLLDYTKRGVIDTAVSTAQQIKREGLGGYLKSDPTGLGDVISDWLMELTHKGWKPRNK